MPFDLSKIAARSRTVTIHGVGDVVVREPTLGDYQRSRTDQFWWGDNLTMPDGSRFVDRNEQLASIRGEIAAALLEAVNGPRPTEPPSGGCGESQARSNG